MMMDRQVADEIGNIDVVRVAVLGITEELEPELAGLFGDDISSQDVVLRRVAGK